MHVCEAERLWDGIRYLVAPNAKPTTQLRDHADREPSRGTVGIMGTNSQRAKIIGEEGTRRGYDVRYMDEDCEWGDYEPAHDWFRMDVVIIADWLNRNTPIPAHTTVVDTACLPFSELAEGWPYDYRWWDGNDLVEQNHLYNHPDIQRVPTAGILHDFYEIYPHLWDIRDQIGWIYYGPTPHQGDPQRVPFEEQVQLINRLFKLGKRYIMLCNSDETLQTGPTGWANRVARYFWGSVPQDTFWLVTGCVTGEAEYRKLCEEHAMVPALNVCTFHRFEHCIRMDMTGASVIEPIYNDPHSQLTPEVLCRNTHDETDFLQHIQYNCVPKPKLFLSFARMPRWQRIQLTAYLINEGLWNKGYISFDWVDAPGGGNTADNIREMESIEYTVTKTLEMTDTDLDYNPVFREERRSSLREFKRNCLPYTFDAFRKVAEHLPLLLNRTVERDNPVQITEEDVHYHDSSRFSIVNETVYYGGHYRPTDQYYPNNLNTLPGVFISEKIYKPLAYCHPFILFSRPGTLQCMRDIGYETFDCLFDENYDSILDDADRFHFLCAEISRVCAMTDEQFAEIQPELKRRTEHNKQRLLQLHSSQQLAITDMSKLTA